MADEVQEDATKDITAWTSTMQNVGLDVREGSMQERIANELTPIRYEITAIRKQLENRSSVDAGEF